MSGGSDLEKESASAISVFGLGKLGSPYAAVMASKGYRVIGVDVQDTVIDKLASGVAPVEEPGLQELLDSCGNLITATTDAESAVLNSKLSCVIVPTPSKDDGVFSVEYVQEAVESIAAALRHDTGYHVVVIVSTVMPGDTERLGDVLVEVSGRTMGEDLGLCYSPEFIALGSVIQDLISPDMLLIGESDPKAGNTYLEVLNRIVEGRPRVSRLNFVNAELAKLAINSYVTTKITYANMIARICENVAGADADHVTHAVGLDSRIGPKYFRGAVAYGGPCFPRDNVALSKFAESVGVNALLAEATHILNLEQNQAMLDLLLERKPPPGKVAVLGLSYKRGTPVVEESASLRLLPELKEAGYEAVGYDPMAAENARRELGDEFVVDTLEEALAEAAAVVILTPWEQFAELSPSQLKACQSDVLIIDAWRILEAERFAGSCTLAYLGRGPDLSTIPASSEGTA